MTSNKQAKAAAKKRQAAFEERIAAKQRHKERVIRITAIVVAAGLLLGGGLAVLLIALNQNRTDARAETPSATSSAESTVSTDLAVPDPSIAESRTWTATLATNRGEIVLELDGAAAPQAVASFVSLAQDGFFDGTDCHRLTTEGIYVLQCGDPTGTGSGGPGYTYGPIENAPSDDVYPAGTIAMARVSGDGESMGSQFFIVYQDSVIPSDAAGGYTVLGRVVDGTASVVDVADAGTITGDTDGPPALSVIVNEVSVS